MEDTKKSIGLGMCALHINRPIQFPDVPYSMEELRAAHDYLSEDERIVIFDPEDERSADNIINKIIYFVKAHNCKIIILDHISMLAYASGDENERKFLDKLSADLKGLTTQLDICLHAIVHVNDDGKTRGSRAPVQLCDALVDLQRDKLNPDPVIANTIDIVVTENRLTGESGLACKVFFDRDTGRLTELDPDLTVSVGERNVQFDS
jgi:twinkle protein